MTSLALSRPPTCVAARVRPASGFPAARAAAAAGRLGARRRASRLPCRAQHREGEEHGASAVGQDLNWSHISRDLRAKLASAAEGKQSTIDQLNAWLAEADLRQRGESDLEEHSQAEVVAAEEASRQGLDRERLDLRAWLGEGGGEGQAGAELDSKVAGALVMRLLQAYHKEAGEPFDDEQDDAYWRLQGFLPGYLVDALSHDMLKRLVKGYLSLPFSGV